MSDPVAPQLDELRRRARRRLVGAVVLALAAAVLVPMLLESEQKPLGEDVSVKIPPIDDDKFVSKLGEHAKPDASKSAQQTADAGPRGGAPATSTSEATKQASSISSGSGKTVAQAEQRVLTPNSKSPKASPGPAVGTNNPDVGAAPSTASAASGATAASVPPSDVKAAPATSKPSAVESSKAPVVSEPKSTSSVAGKPARGETTKSPGVASDAKSASASPGKSASTDAISPPAMDAKAPTPAPTRTVPAETAKSQAGDVASQSRSTDPFSVQLAAFADDKGANALAGKLKKAGHPAYTEPYSTSRGTLWRVRVGPYPTRDAAEAARTKLKAEGQNGIIAAGR